MVPIPIKTEPIVICNTTSKKESAFSVRTNSAALAPTSAVPVTSPSKRISILPLTFRLSPTSLRQIANLLSSLIASKTVKSQPFLHRCWCAYRSRTLTPSRRPSSRNSWTRAITRSNCIPSSRGSESKSSKSSPSAKSRTASPARAMSNTPFSTSLNQNILCFRAQDIFHFYQPLKTFGYVLPSSRRHSDHQSCRLRLLRPQLKKKEEPSVALLFLFFASLL